jgi:thiamine-monophosphate kinase
MTSSGPGEFDLIRRLLSHRRPRRADVLVDAGDDAAAVVTEKGECLLFTCDTQAHGVHFSDSIPPFALGRRLAAVNLSDIAAMGGRPAWALVSLLLPSGEPVSWTDDMYRGICQELERYDADIVGGNVSATRGPLTMELFLAGQVPVGKVLRRSGARVGDLVCVTGTLGDSAAGLMLTSRPEVSVDASVREVLIHRHWMPSPRVAAGQYLARCGHVSACIDISDGLFQDAGHLATSSGVGITIHLDSLPLSSEARRAGEACGEDAVTWALSGGEDYELLFTVPENRVESVLCGLQTGTDTHAARIGVVGTCGAPGDAVVVLHPDGSVRRDIRAGHDHLARSFCPAKGSS